jgi:hypothetical protein
MLPGAALDLAPGLWAIGLGLALVAALGRWFDRVPWPAVGLYLGLVAALYGPALFGGRVLLAVDNLRAVVPFTGLAPAEPPGNHLQGDQVLELAPLQAEVRQAVRRGEWPLWSPSIGAGTPLLANPEAQALQPLVLAAAPLPLPRAAGAVAALRVVAALVFAHLLLARLGASPWAAAAGAVAYGLGGFLQLWLGWPRANVAALLPALLYAVVMAEARGWRRDLLLLTSAAAAVLLGGDPDVAGYALIAAAALAAARVARRPPAERARPLLAQGAAVALAFGLAAPALLPAAGFLPRTPEAFALDGRAEVELRGDPFGLVTLADPARRSAALGAALHRTLPALAPNAQGNSRYSRYWGPVNSNEDAAVFAGTAALLLALFAAGARLREAWRSRRPARLAEPPGGARAAVPAGGGPLDHEGLFLALAGIALLIVARPPVLAQLLDHVPYLGPSPVFHQRVALLFVLAVAALAASGLGRLAAVAPWRGRLAMLAPAALALGAAIVWAYLAHPPLADSPAGSLGGLSARWLAIQLGALGVAVLGLAAIRRPGRRALALCAVLAAELALLHGPANPALPRRLYYPTPEPLAFLQRAAAAEPGARIAAVDGALPPLIPAIYGLADPRTRARAASLDYQHLIEPLLTDGGPALLFRRPAHPLWDLLGVRWLLAPPGRDLVGDLAGDLPGLRLVLDHPDGRVFERPGALPRLFLPGSAEVHRPERPWAAQVAAIADFRRTALVQGALGHTDDWAAAAAPAGLQITALEPARIAAVADLAEERLLATSIHQDGGWRLLVDGEPHPTILANGPLVAAWLPPGRHRLELLYRPESFRSGMLLAALSLAILLTWAGRPR